MKEFSGEKRGMDRVISATSETEERNKSRQAREMGKVQENGVKFGQAEERPKWGRGAWK